MFSSCSDFNENFSFSLLRWLQSPRKFREPGFEENSSRCFGRNNASILSVSTTKHLDFNIHRLQRQVFIERSGKNGFFFYDKRISRPAPKQKIWWEKTRLHRIRDFVLANMFSIFLLSIEFRRKPKNKITRVVYDWVHRYLSGPCHIKRRCIKDSLNGCIQADRKSA